MSFLSNEFVRLIPNEGIFSNPDIADFYKFIFEITGDDELNDMLDE